MFSKLDIMGFAQPIMLTSFIQGFAGMTKERLYSKGGTF